MAVLSFSWASVACLLKTIDGHLVAYVILEDVSFVTDVAASQTKRPSTKRGIRPIPQGRHLLARVSVPRG